MRVLVTGASGSLGSALCAALEARGDAVRRGGRKPGRSGSWFRCDLPDGLDGTAFAGADVCIHCAYTTRSATRRDAGRTNIEGTRAVLRACREHRVKFVFISSLSAHPRAGGFYGQSKHLLEAELDPLRDLIIRPGFIIAPDGLFARMERATRAPLIPLFEGGGQVLQPVFIGDLVAAITAAVDQGMVGALNIGDERGLTMREMLVLTAESLGRKPRFVSVPSRWLLALLEPLERVGLPLPISPDNIRGLRSLERHETASDVQRLGVSIRPPRDAVAALGLLRRGAARVVRGPD